MSAFDVRTPADDRPTPLMFARTAAEATARLLHPDGRTAEPLDVEQTGDSRWCVRPVFPTVGSYVVELTEPGAEPKLLRVFARDADHPTPDTLEG